MESFLIKIGLILKWLIPAAIGSGMAIFIDKEPHTNKYKWAIFFFGLSVSAIVGGGVVEFWDIQMKAVQAAIYFSFGVWGIGIIVQINEQMPQLVRAFFSKIFGVEVKGKSE